VSQEVGIQNNSPGNHQYGGEAVGGQEEVSRFVLFERDLRENDTIKHNVLLPHPYRDLSVTRHTGISIQELWQLGEDVANLRRQSRPNASLLGRGDFSASDALALSLTAYRHEPPKNHVHIGSWPSEKPMQMLLAQKLAASITFVRNPV
jgi:hypothetical protein